ncbi:MAG: hypothetical protein LBJ36_00545 [Synergistaceae bacterium]|jgi:hypothetical protein|nr:hypothetical protein [Synergistaceae bacterium]
MTHEDDTELDKRKEYEIAARARGLRRNLYEHVNLSLRTVDIVITIVSILIIALILLGISKK